MFAEDSHVSISVVILIKMKLFMHLNVPSFQHHHHCGLPSGLLRKQEEEMTSAGSCWELSVAHGRFFPPHSVPKENKTTAPAFRAQTEIKKGLLPMISKLVYQYFRRLHFYVFCLHWAVVTCVFFSCFTTVCV